LADGYGAQESHVFLCRFGVKDYKCLGEIDVPLTPIHVLIGPNDSGKTSLLEAMAALHASAELALPDAFPKPWSGRELVRHEAEGDKAEFWGEWTTGNGKAASTAAEFAYRLSVTFPHDGQACFVDSEVIRVDAEEASAMRIGSGTSALHFWRQNPGCQTGLPSKLLTAAAEILKATRRPGGRGSGSCSPVAIGNSPITPWPWA
jgi:predicted ATPase